jgi:hypothetical protein
MLDPISEDPELAVEDGAKQFSTLLNLFFCGAFPRNTFLRIALPFRFRRNVFILVQNVLNM